MSYNRKYNGNDPVAKYRGQTVNIIYLIFFDVIHNIVEYKLQINKFECAFYTFIHTWTNICLYKKISLTCSLKTNRLIAKICLAFPYGYNVNCHAEYHTHSKVSRWNEKFNTNNILTITFTNTRVIGIACVWASCEKIEISLYVPTDENFTRLKIAEVVNLALIRCALLCML